jgi:hypothetical protein
LNPRWSLPEKPQVLEAKHTISWSTYHLPWRNLLNNPTAASSLMMI